MSREERILVTSRTSLLWGSAIALRSGWLRWQRGDATRRILATSVVLMVLTVVCKLGAGTREVVTAYWFGASDALDAFVVALTIPTFAAMALGNAAGSALLPTFTRVRERQGHATANRLLQETTFWTALLLLGAACIVAVSSGWLLDLVGPGFASWKQMLAHQLMLVLVPVIVLRGIISLHASVLNSQEQFTASGLTPVLTPLACIIVLLMLGNRLGICALAWGMTIGALAETIVLAWVLRSTGYRLCPRLAAPSPELVQVFRQYLPLAVAAALMSSTTIVDNAMASRLGSGSVATLSYGRKLVLLAISIPTLSISRAIFPYLSRLVAQRNWNQLRDTLRKSQTAVMLVMIPLAVALFCFARPLTAFVLQRGAFGAQDTDSVAWVQAMYALQIPFYAASILYVRLISSLGRNHLLTISTVVSILLNIGLNYLLIRVMGVAGIALSTSIVYAVACAFLMYISHRSMRQNIDVGCAQIAS